MLRLIQATFCAVVVFVVSGCTPKQVEEIPPAEKQATPSISEEERQKALELEKQRGETAAKKLKALQGTGGKKKDGT
jgi:predicted small lipoprotein YifL